MRRPLVRWLPAALLAAVLLSGCSRPPGWPAPDDDLYPVADFSLTERSGRTVRRDDLAGKIWVAAFIFTRCAGPCTQISGTMARLQHDLAGLPDLRLVSFTVDPEYDTPEVLRAYAARYAADPDRWLFLTGKPEAVYQLIGRGFHLYAEPNKGTDRTPGNEVAHDTRLAVVDRRGHIRGYFDGRDPQAVGQLEAKVKSLARDGSGIGVGDLPSVNAALNATCAVLLVLGYTAIRRRAVALHKTCMLAAVGVSLLFLASYLYYHLVVRRGEPTRFTGEGWVRDVYLAILLSHTLLAAVVAPLILFTAFQGLRGRLARHVRVARWVLPVWLYVSVTGVVVYGMLYHLYPARPAERNPFEHVMDYNPPRLVLTIEPEKR